MGSGRSRRAHRQTLVSRRNGPLAKTNASRRKNETNRLLATMAKRHEGPKAIVREKSPDSQMPIEETRGGSILAVDYGRARIGLAIADQETGLPRPLLTLERINRNEDMRRF